MSRPDPYLSFSREEWRKLRANTPLLLEEAELSAVRGINEKISLQEVEDIYLPLSRLLNLYVAATHGLHNATDTFLGGITPRAPFIIGIAGSVAAGKSTISRVLQILLSRWPDHPHVELVTTDGFLYPNETLRSAGLLERKGFPESYDLRALLSFLADVKAGSPELRVPTYSHLIYDVADGKFQVIRRPDILILEGLNVLQSGGARPSRLFVSDYFDFSIYVDAEEEAIERWYVERFLTLCATVFRHEGSYFHRYAGLSEDEKITTARGIWHTINSPNLKENIRPTRERAHLILEKGSGHFVKRVRLRKR